MNQDDTKALYGEFLRACDSDQPIYAVLLAKHCLSLDASNGALWCMYGDLLTDLGRYRDAEDSFDRAIGHLPETKQHLPARGMANLMEVMGKYEDSLAWHKKAIAIKPSDATGYVFLSAVLSKAGYVEQAIEQLHVAVKCKEGDISEAYLNLGLLLRAQERFEDSLMALNSAIELDTECTEAHDAKQDVENAIKFLLPPHPLP